MSDKDSQKSKSEEPILKTFDMYHFFSRKDVIVAIVFIVAFLIFSIAAQFLPEAI